MADAQEDSDSIQTVQNLIPNGRVLTCMRCESPVHVGYRCWWCFDYPERDKQGRIRPEATAPIPPAWSPNDVAAHICQSASCAGRNVVAVGPCSWCGKVVPFADQS